MMIKPEFKFTQSYSRASEDIMITQNEQTVSKSILNIKELNLVYAMWFPLFNR